MRFGQKKSFLLRGIGWAALFLLCLLCTEALPAQTPDAAPRPIALADVRRIHDEADFERLYQVGRVPARYQSADAVNRYRKNLLTPELVDEIDRLLAGTAPVPALTGWVRDFRAVIELIYGPGYPWSDLQTRVISLQERYQALTKPPS